jgi:hypothetical protein
VVTGLGHINDRDTVVWTVVGVLGASLGRHKSPEFVKVHSWAMEHLLGAMEITHTNLSEVTRMVLIKVNTMMMLTTGATATTWVLTVLTDTTVTGGDVTALFAVLAQTRRLEREREKERERKRERDKKTKKDEKRQGAW